MVLFLDQTLKDIERFCCQENIFSPLAADTTFNIGEYLFTQTTYKNLSLIRTDTGKHPWFPGPIMIHRRQRENDFSFFWQSVLRGNKELKWLKVLGTDECDELSEGILSQTVDTTHLLGLEHVEKNIEKKLDDLNFPRNVKYGILDAIFGERGLVNTSTFESFDEKLNLLIPKWNEAEGKYTKNNPPSKFSQYFIEYKADKIRNNMSKTVRDKLHLTEDYRQNFIE